jgi:predicted permease
MRLLDTLHQDARYAIRMLFQNPGFAAVAILSLALGIGANTAIFSLIDTVLLRSLPVRDPQQLVVFARNPDDPGVGSNYPDYRYIRDHNQSFSGVAAYGGSGQQAAFAVPEEGSHAVAELVTPLEVSGNFFDLLGVVPAVGRMLRPEDNLKEDGHPWVVLDYDFWQRRFAADPAAVGRKVTLNGSPFTIVGVAHAGFIGPQVGVHPDVYAPIVMRREIQRSAEQWNTRHYWWLTILCRLKPGVTRAAAIPEVDTLWHQILAGDPEEKRRPYDKDYDIDNRGTLMEASGGYSFLRNQIQKPLLVLMTVVGLVLLIACANVANLLLARAAARQREIAIRLAVGAGRARLIRQLVLETVVIALAGGVAGTAFAWWGVRVLIAFLPKRSIPLALDLTPDWRLLGFSFAICLMVGLVCGILPALQATRPNLTMALKNESSAAGRVRFDLRRALVVTQVAVSLLLLIGAGLLVRSLENLKSLDPGFIRERVLVVDVNPGTMGYKGRRLRDFYDRLLERTRALPDVRAAALSNITPFSGSRWNDGTSFEGYERQADERPWVDHNAVSPGFFGSLGIPLLEGRDFRDEDNPAVTPDPQPGDDEKLGPPRAVAILNEAAANKYFAHQNPIGRHFSHGDKFDNAKAFEIVGVVKNSNYFDIRKAVEPMVYVPVWRLRASGNTLSVRTAGDPERVANAIRREVASIDASVPVLQTFTMEQQFDNTIAQERTVTTLCGFFGLLAVLLAAIGLYGVMAHSVTRRYREIGIRMALGAERRIVMWMVLRETLWMIVIGAAIGLPVAFATTRLVRSFLYGLTPQDPLSIVLATIGLAIITGLAGYIPALRATRVDPMVALRYE